MSEKSGLIQRLRKYVGSVVVGVDLVWSYEPFIMKFSKKMISDVDVFGLLVRDKSSSRPLLSCLDTRPILPLITSRVLNAFSDISKGLSIRVFGLLASKATSFATVLWSWHFTCTQILTGLAARPHVGQRGDMS